MLKYGNLRSCRQHSSPFFTTALSSLCHGKLEEFDLCIKMSPLFSMTLNIMFECGDPSVTKRPTTFIVRLSPPLMLKT